MSHHCQQAAGEHSARALRGRLTENGRGGEGACRGHVRGTGWEHVGTCWKRAPSSPQLLTTAGLGTDPGLAGSEQTGGPDASQLQGMGPGMGRGTEGGAEKGPLAGGGGGREGLLSAHNVHAQSHSHACPHLFTTHTLIQTFIHSPTLTHTRTPKQLSLNLFTMLGSGYSLI